MKEKTIREGLYLKEENLYFLERISKQTVFKKSDIANFAIEYFRKNFHKIFLDREKRTWYDLSE